MAPLVDVSITERDLKQLSSCVSQTLSNHVAKARVATDKHMSNGTANDKPIINNNNLGERDNGPYLNGTSPKCNGAPTKTPLPSRFTIKDSIMEHQVEIKELIDPKAKLFRISILGNEGCGLIVDHREDEDEDDDDVMSADDETVNEEESEMTGDDEPTDTESQIDLPRPVPTVNQRALDCLPNERKYVTERHIPLVVGLTEPCARLESVTGGKGSSLALLRCLSANDALASDPRFQFTVPYGVVVTTVAYKEMLRVNDNAAREIERLEKECK